MTCAEEPVVLVDLSPKFESEVSEIEIANLRCTLLEVADSVALADLPAVKRFAEPLVESAGYKDIVLSAILRELCRVYMRCTLKR